MKGKLIVFEALDCAGKTTQIRKAYERLKSEGYKVILTREPGGTPIGEEIRKIIKNDKIARSPITQAYLFAASRAEHNIQIARWIEDGNIVLCDRHLLSSLIYNKDPKEIYSVIKINESNNEPLLTHNININYIILDITNEEFLKRIGNRKTLDKLDVECINTFSTKRKEYLKLGKLLKAEIVNSSESIDEVHNKIMSKIYSIIKEEK